MYLPGHDGYGFIGVGKIDIATKKFTGIMSYATAARQVILAACGVGVPYNADSNFIHCRSDAACAWTYGLSSGSSGYAYNGGVIGASALTLDSYQKYNP